MVHLLIPMARRWTPKSRQRPARDEITSHVCEKSKGFENLQCRITKPRRPPPAKRRSILKRALNQHAVPTLDAGSPPSAQRPRPDATHCLSAARPPARPTQRGPRKIFLPAQNAKKKRQENHPSQRSRPFNNASLVWPCPPARGASISPPESEGIAAGDDEDEAGEVRSEGSGPQSWPRALGGAAAPGG